MNKYISYQLFILIFEWCKEREKECDHRFTDLCGNFQESINFDLRQGSMKLPEKYIYTCIYLYTVELVNKFCPKDIRNAALVNWFVPNLTVDLYRHFSLI